MANQPQGTIWSLVRHDMKFRKRRNVQVSKKWWLAYAAVIAIVVIAATTYASVRGNLDFNYIWFFTFALPFVVFGLTIGLTVREWKNGTAGWWLTLPMSRLRLVTSKFIAGVLRGLIVFLCVYLIIDVLSLYAMLLQGTFTPHVAGQFLLTGLKWFALLVCISPFIGSLGALFGVLTHSRAKPAIPLFWMVWGALWWFVFSSGSSFPLLFVHISSKGGMASFDWPMAIWIPLVASWILAYLMVRLAGYLLDRQLNL